MKRDLHLKKIYVAITLTALIIIPTAFAIGAFLDNKKSSYRVTKTTSIKHQQAESVLKDAVD